MAFVAKFFTTPQKNGFISINRAAASSIGSKYEVKNEIVEYQNLLNRWNGV